MYSFDLYIIIFNKQHCYFKSEYLRKRRFITSKSYKILIIFSSIKYKIYDFNATNELNVAIENFGLF